MRTPGSSQLQLELGGPGPAPAPPEKLTPETAILLSVGKASTRMGAIQEAHARLHRAGKRVSRKSLHAAWRELVRKRRLEEIPGGWRVA